MIAATIIENIRGYNLQQNQTEESANAEDPEERSHKRQSME